MLRQPLFRHFISYDLYLFGDKKETKNDLTRGWLIVDSRLTGDSRLTSTRARRRTSTTFPLGSCPTGAGETPPRSPTPYPFCIPAGANERRQYSQAKTEEEESKLLQESIPKSNAYKTKWAIKIFHHWQINRKVPVLDAGGAFKDYGDLSKVQSSKYGCQRFKLLAE